MCVLGMHPSPSLAAAIHHALPSARHSSSCTHVRFSTAAASHGLGTAAYETAVLSFHSTAAPGTAVLTLAAILHPTILPCPNSTPLHSGRALLHMCAAIMPCNRLLGRIAAGQALAVNHQRQHGSCAASTQLRSSTSFLLQPALLVCAHVQRLHGTDASACTAWLARVSAAATAAAPARPPHRPCAPQLPASL